MRRSVSVDNFLICGPEVKEIVASKRASESIENSKAKERKT